MVINNCYVICNTGPNANNIVYLPCYPDEIAESISATWQEQQIIGRSSPVATYTGTSFRRVSFSFDMHEDMDYNGSGNVLSSVVQQLRCCVYPEYNKYKPPISLIRLGEFVCRGVVTNLSVTWKKPINTDSGYKLCTVSIEMNEILNKVPQASDISSNPYNPFEMNSL